MGRLRRRTPTIAWFGILGGILLAAAVQAITRDESRLTRPGSGPTAARILAAEPRSRGARWAWVARRGGAAASRCSWSPLDVVQAVVTLLGAFVFYAAVVYLLDVLVLPAGAESGDAPPAKGRAWAIGVAGSLGVAARSPAS